MRVAGNGEFYSRPYIGAHAGQVYGTVGEEVVACIGPGISLESFEVGDEVYEAFRLNGFDMSRISCRNANTGKFHIDLWETNRQQLFRCSFFTNRGSRYLYLYSS